MILVGSMKAYKQITFEGKEFFLLFNLSQPIDEPTAIPINILPDIDIKMSINDLDFDIFLADYVIKNDQAFFEMMKVIFALDLGFNVFILIGEGEIHETLAESFTKMIQVRYGYNCQYVQSVVDVNWDDDSEFSAEAINGILPQDSKRYNQLCNIYSFPENRYK
ncbi:MAG: hypothetical protein PHC62_00885 [Candidatus Izemoplasmatales bacterium]|nr:hypothetical protein [Candidatus Izemoplasmatales bacterium]